MTYLRESFAYAGGVLRTMTPANAARAGGRTVRRQEHSLRIDDARDLARVGSLRPTRRVPPNEWNRAAGEPACAGGAHVRVGARRFSRTGARTVR